MGRQSRPPRHNATSDPAQERPVVRSLTEWVVLALLIEAPAHGFALSKDLTADSDLGRIVTVRRPLVYRALDRLVEAGLATPLHTEPGDSGPARTVYRPTNAGSAAAEGWLSTPVDHVRDLRVEFLVKLRLLQRRDRSDRQLVDAQRASLDETIARLIERPGTGATVGAGAGVVPSSAEERGPQSGEPVVSDVVDLWRAHNALAVSRFLDELQAER